ncbi:MAG: hypothetical protein LBR93_06270, partial [Treponema sp.]|nr:hypothetical protein [Treponema sp.]
MKKTLIVTLGLMILLSAAVYGAGTSEKTGEKVHLVFWHGLGGSNGETIKLLADQFNASQDRISVEPQFQGSYEDSINKLRSSMRTKSGPDVVQIYEGGTRFMV